MTLIFSLVQNILELILEKVSYDDHKVNNQLMSRGRNDSRGRNNNRNNQIDHFNRDPFEDMNHIMRSFGGFGNDFFGRGMRDPF